MIRDRCHSPAARVPGRLESPETLARRVKAEYHEMPGLDLTFGQARCLFGLETPMCETVLDLLCAEGFLVRTARGSYRSSAERSSAA